MVRSFGVDGSMLLEPSKIEALLVPQLKPATTLLFEKLMFILEELKPTAYRQSQSSPQRHSRDTLSIHGQLMKTIRNGRDFVKEKNMVLWNTEDLLGFLGAVGLDRFRGAVERTACDGLIMLYVVPDRRKLLRMSRFCEGKELQEIVYISQLMLAQSFMAREVDECEDVEEVELSPHEHSEIVFNMRRVQSYESLAEDAEDYMLVQSMESAYEQNDFIMTEDADNASILETIEPEKEDEERERQGEREKWEGRVRRVSDKQIDKDK